MQIASDFNFSAKQTRINQFRAKSQRFDDAACVLKIKCQCVQFTSRLPPFPFAFGLAVAFSRSSSQTNNRSTHSRCLRPTESASDAERYRDSARRPRKVSAGCLSGVGGLVGFGV